MIQGFYPYGAIDPDGKKISIQSLLFGHRLKPQQTRYEYLVEFLQVAFASKKILDSGCTDIISDLFPVSDELNDHVVEYMPVSNMGLKRFIFFENSRLESKSNIDREAYQRCLEIIKDSVQIDGADISEKECIFILQKQSHIEY